jgi:hypothetical protein
VRRDGERVPLDPLEHAGREDDPVAGDPRQRPHRQRCALVLVEVARAQLEDPAPVHVVLAHQRPQLGDHRLAALALDGHELEPECLLHAAVQDLSITTSGPDASRTSQKLDCTHEMLSCSASGTVTCSTAPGWSRLSHSCPPTSWDSPAR